MCQSHFPQCLGLRGRSKKSSFFCPLSRTPLKGGGRVIKAKRKEGWTGWRGSSDPLTSPCPGWSYIPEFQGLSFLMFWKPCLCSGRPQPLCIQSCLSSESTGTAGGVEAASLLNPPAGAPSHLLDWFATAGANRCWVFPGGKVTEHRCLGILPGGVFLAQALIIAVNA